MTLIVIHEGKVYCDSFCTVGPDSNSTSKIRTTVWGETAITYTCAGSPDSASEVMELLAQTDVKDWLSLDLSRFGNNSDNTIVVFRHPVHQDTLGIIALGCERPMISPANAPQVDGLQFMGGSGWNWFYAFYKEHNDLERAFELTALLHRDVAAPFVRF